MGTILTLEEAREHIGHGVIYKVTGEQGVITSVSEHWVFVRYGANPGSAATSAGMLTLLAADLAAPTTPVTPIPVTGKEDAR